MLLVGTEGSMVIKVEIGLAEETKGNTDRISSYAVHPEQIGKLRLTVNGIVLSQNHHQHRSTFLDKFLACAWCLNIPP